MRKKKEKNKFTLGSIPTILILILLTMMMSAAFSMLEIEASKTVIVNGALETSMTTVQNILTVEGIQNFLGNIVVNFRLFEPLALIILSLIMIGIGEASGIFQILFEPLKRCKSSFITLLVLFVSIISSFLGESSYALLIPFVAVIYRYLGKNQMLGIFTVFLGLTIGYGTNLFYTYDDYLLGTLTQAAATVDVDKNYQFHLFSNLYIMIASTVILTFVGTWVIKSFIEPKLPKAVKSEENEETYINSKKALYYTIVTFILGILCILYMMVPGFFGSGILLDKTQNNYMAQLFSPTSPFRDGILFLFLLLSMICGAVYGKVSGNIKSSHDYSLKMAKTFDSLGYLFVLMFFLSIWIGVVNWTNLGEVIGAKLIEIMASLEFSGILLIIMLFFVIIFMSIFIPSTSTKWILTSPILIPLFMRSNVTPDFTQFIFRAADGVGKSISPLFGYFVVLIAFLQKYNNSDKEVTVFGTLKYMIPSILILTFVWILILMSWYIVGLPIGIGTSATL